jgi:rubrerythrin
MGQTSSSRHRLHELHGTRTHENLKAAYALDAQACRMWSYFGRIAEIEGFPEVARVFRELGESQVVFADGHLDFLMRAGDPLGDAQLGETVLNTRAARAALARDASEDLPEMARTARAEGFMDIASWFDTLVESRAAHARRLEEALHKMERG